MSEGGGCDMRGGRVWGGELGEMSAQRFGAELIAANTFLACNCILLCPLPGGVLRGDAFCHHYPGWKGPPAVSKVTKAEGQGEGRGGLVKGCSANAAIVFLSALELSAEGNQAPPYCAAMIGKGGREGGRRGVLST